MLTRRLCPRNYTEASRDAVHAARLSVLTGLPITGTVHLSFSAGTGFRLRQLLGKRIEFAVPGILGTPLLQTVRTSCLACGFTARQPEYTEQRRGKQADRSG